jgi:hypothetical protein
MRQRNELRDLVNYCEGTKGAWRVRLTDHPLWPELRPYICVETYDRDGGHAHPRHRFEVRRVPPTLAPRFLAIEVACATCGRAIAPIRQRRGAAGNLFLAVSCLLSVRVGCARSPKAAAEYRHIIDAL